MISGIKKAGMEKTIGKGERRMINGNKNSLDELDRVKLRAENEKLKRILKKAVNSEKAPESLKQRIGKMIREK